MSLAQGLLYRGSAQSTGDVPQENVERRGLLQQRPPPRHSRATVPAALAPYVVTRQLSRRREGGGSAAFPPALGSTFGALGSRGGCMAGLWGRGGSHVEE